MKSDKPANPFRDPTYNLPSAAAYEHLATPAEKALSALKVGAILAAVVTITLIYVGSYGGLQGQQDLVSLIVLAAFVLPSVLAYLLAWRARLRRRGRKADLPSGREPDA